MKFKAFLFLYFVASLYFLDRYPAYYGDESLFTEPAVHLLKEGNFGTRMYPPFSGTEKHHPFQGVLYTAMQAGVIKIFGVSVFASRLLSFCLGLFLMFLTYQIALTMFARYSVAELSVVVLAVSHLFIFASHFARPDMAVSVVVALSVWLFLLATQQQRS